VSRVVPSDAAWPERFEAERALLEPVLAPWLAGGIHHVGSTAVPGLAAKPVIDMLAGVSDLEAARAAFEPLARAGYSYRVHRPEAHAFRDALRGSAELRREYEAWKLANASADGDPGPYRASKTPFVARVLVESGIELKPDAERLAR